jgi:pimeloyl-ACP methyl ester carboxylesterase
MTFAPSTHRTVENHGCQLFSAKKLTFSEMTQQIPNSLDWVRHTFAKFAVLPQFSQAGHNFTVLLDGREIVVKIEDINLPLNKISFRPVGNIFSDSLVHIEQNNGILQIRFQPPATFSDWHVTAKVLYALLEKGEKESALQIFRDYLWNDPRLKSSLRKASAAFFEGRPNQEIELLAALISKPATVRRCVPEGFKKIVLSESSQAKTFAYFNKNQDDSAPTLVVLPGYGLSSLTFAKQAEVIQELYQNRFNVLFLEPNHHGEFSNIPITMCSIETAQLKTALTDLKTRYKLADDLYLLGFSYGSLLALDLANKDSSVRSVLVSSPPNFVADLQQNAFPAGFSKLFHFDYDREGESRIILLSRLISQELYREDFLNQNLSLQPLDSPKDLIRKLPKDCKLTLVLEKADALFNAEDLTQWQDFAAAQNFPLILAAGAHLQGLISDPRAFAKAAASFLSIN